MFVVEKRNGAVVDFNIKKISDAIRKAFIAVKRDDHPDIIDNLTLQVTANFGHKVNDGVITVEAIQDSVEEVLINSGFADVAKAYILYRKQHEKIREVGSTLLNYKSVVDNYLKTNDWRVKENATVTYSVGGLILSNSGAVTANYWLSEVYDEEIANAHKEAMIHIHDLSMLTGYCAGWSLKQLIKEGLGGIPGKVASSPAAHLSTLCNQMVNFLGIMQNEWAGAQAFSSFDTYLAPFVKVDNLPYKEVKQCIQSFIYGVNTPSRWGTQSPFTNVTIDWTVPNDLAELPAIVAGRELDFKYKDCKREMDMVNKAFMEVMIEGDANGRGFQYPIPTYSITRDFDWSETENNKLLFEMAAKYGIPYFSNYVNSDMEPSDVRSMCCRLRLDLRELRKKSGGFFGSGESTGSIGVVTINMPHLAYVSENEEDFYKRLDELMDISAKSLKIKRTTIEKFLESGLYPYTKRYLGTFNNHFSTIGLVGMNEACLNAKWLQCDLTNKRALDFTKEVLNHMRTRLSDYQEKYGDLYNLEATPAESTSYRFAKHDKAKFPNIITANEQGTPYYTNSSHLPVSFTDDIFAALDVQDDLQTLYTSGTVFHAFLGEKLPDWRAAATLVKTIANNYKLPYYTLSPTYSVCKNHGYITGEVPVCPICGEKTEVNSRITGYYRPVANWNEGKSQEFKDRKTYEINFNKIQLNQNPSTQAVPQNNISQPSVNNTQVSQPQVNSNFSQASASAVNYNNVNNQPAQAAPVNTNQTANTSPLNIVPADGQYASNTSNMNQSMTPNMVQTTIPSFMNDNSISNDILNTDVVDVNNNSNQNVVIREDSSQNNYGMDNLNIQFSGSLGSYSDASEGQGERYKLYVTKYCPNCSRAKEILDRAGVAYDVVDAQTVPAECARLGIMQAPTLVVDSNHKYTNVSNIIRFVESNAYKI